MTPLDDRSSTPHPWEKSYPKDLRWDAEIPEMTMVELFDTAVKKFQDRPCLDFMDKKYTFREVGEMVDRFAKGLQDQGIGKGSKVGLCLPNTPFYVVAYHAALKAGATVVNFNPLYPEKEMEDQVVDSQVDMMVTLNLEQIFPKVESALGKARLKMIVVCDFADALPGKTGIAFKAINTLSSLTGRVPFVGKKLRALRDKKGVQPVSKIKRSKSLLSFEKMLKSKGPLKPVNIHPDDIAVLQYTGGTTGVPKAAMLSHGNLSANTQQAALWFNGGGQGATNDKSLAVLPFFHVFSMTILMNLPLHMGGEIIMLPKFEVNTALKTITDKKPTIFAGVPTIYSAITKALAAGNKADLSSLKVCISGGAPLSPATLTAFKEKTGIELLEGYGLSESSAAAIANPLNGTKKPGSIGLPMPQTEVKLVSSLPGADTAVTMEGEICLRGPQVMKGYWNRSEETKNVLENGWLKTGDIGRMDDDGYISIVGRVKDMIIASGLKVFPRKVEEAILKHEAIDDVAVIGVPDEKRGENVKAFIVLKPGKTVTDKALDDFLRQYLAAYEVPKIVERRDSLPLTLIGKPDKKALKKEQEAADAKLAAARTAPKKNGPQPG